MFPSQSIIFLALVLLLYIIHHHVIIIIIIIISPLILIKPSLNLPLYPFEFTFVPEIWVAVFMVFIGSSDGGGGGGGGARVVFECCRGFYA